MIENSFFIPSFSLPNNCNAVELYKSTLNYKVNESKLHFKTRNFKFEKKNGMEQKYCSKLGWARNICYVLLSAIVSGSTSKAMQKFLTSSKKQKQVKVPADNYKYPDSNT